MGETIDKATILDLKISKVLDEEKLKILKKERQLLEPLPNVGPFKTLLFYINSTLWEVEDTLREHENMNNFDSEFMLLARSVYFINDMRSKVKNQISKIVGEELKDIKLYT